MKTVNEIHLKHIDDLTLAEAINLPKNVKFKPAIFFYFIINFNT